MAHHRCQLFLEQRTCHEKKQAWVQTFFPINTIKQNSMNSKSLSYVNHKIAPRSLTYSHLTLIWAKYRWSHFSTTCLVLSAFSCMVQQNCLSRQASVGVTLWWLNGHLISKRSKRMTSVEWVTHWSIWRCTKERVGLADQKSTGANTRLSCPWLCWYSVYLVIASGSWVIHPML